MSGLPNLLLKILILGSFFREFALALPRESALLKPALKLLEEGEALTDYEAMISPFASYIA